MGGEQSAEPHQARKVVAMATAIARKPLERAVEASEIARGLRHYGLTQEAIARATGATARSVRNWESTSAIRPRSEERLGDLREIVLLLKGSLTERGVGQWLRARNHMLGGRRPLDLLAEGKAEKVREAAAAYAEGGFV